ncbi:MAG: aspartyl-phosphate phosphatase Spo0E family protein [Bacillota bacterium]|nr:aspartyl-phosphate phosphatase Spo0E family protein [Bacillota bacterium]
MKVAGRDQIEELRLQMQKIALDKTLTDPRVVKVSEELDVLINQFYLNPLQESVAVTYSN